MKHKQAANRARTRLPLRVVDLADLQRRYAGFFSPYLQRRIDDVRRSGGTVVATGGCFDLLHPGHIATLQRARRLGDIRRWTEMESGGHFPAAEEPEALASDLRAFFRHLP